MNDFAKHYSLKQGSPNFLLPSLCLRKIEVFLPTPDPKLSVTKHLTELRPSCTNLLPSDSSFTQSPAELKSGIQISSLMCSYPLDNMSATWMSFHITDSEECYSPFTLNSKCSWQTSSQLLMSCNPHF